MEISSVAIAVKNKVEQFPYRGKNLPVKDVYIQWLSQAGPADSPEYGLRLFTVGPGGEIPIHKHFYYQTMFILSGSLIGYAYDMDTDETTMEQSLGTGELAFIPTMEPHSFVNPSDTEECTFLCCIANVYEDEGQ
ncbi:MAG: cupin domain-containing protein [Proteobacteria bacterium]|nr:cupin domain-containing protein [Pseudomonadota bacterium]